MLEGLKPLPQRTLAGTIPHSRGLLAVSTSSRVDLGMLYRLPLKLLLARVSAYSVGDFLQGPLQDRRSIGGKEIIKDTYEKLVPLRQL